MHRSPLFLLLFLLSSLLGQAQIFQLYELEKYDPATQSGLVKNNSYADINSTLVLKIDKPALLQAMNNYAQVESGLSEKLRQLRFILENQNEILAGFQVYSKDSSLEPLNNLAEEMVTFLTKIREMPDMRALYEQFSTLYTATYTRAQIRSTNNPALASDGVPRRDEFVLVKFQEYAATLAQEIAASLDQSQVKVIFSGYIRNKSGWRQVKLSDDFDTKVEEIYTVPRWQTEMTAEDRAQLVAIDSLATNLNLLVDTKAEDIKNWLADAFSADECLGNLQNRLQEVPGTITSLADAGKAEIEAIVAESVALVDDLSRQYVIAEDRSPGITSVSLLEGFSGQLNSTATSIQTLVSNIDDRLLTRLQGLTEAPELQNFVSTYEGCKADLAHDRDVLLGVGMRLRTLFSSGQSSAKFSMELGEDIRRLSYDAVPAESYIDLQGTGNRANGDQMKVIATLEEGSGDDAVRVNVDTRIFSLQQIGMYSVIKPMLLLANPTRDPGPNSNIRLDEKKFQFAASYSLLFKFGSRTSRAFNEVWQPAIGVNFGALDFDTDGTPEFSAALEFDFLKDYFALGYGYDFGVSETFFMLGFRLPIGAVPLPLFNAVESTN
ncbi:MAG: hypothetical protein DA408_10010 [Bacteroidetes bacterium]|nr:MAG: hypothetical protein C7N36_20005 [Bacteroidota bacterium]PTM12623.1 MAG: hypothetical protein DA408_10010 [Bacteroidota bacterium]